MSEITDWFQNNWIDLARLLVQGAILAAVVRYGRKLLATLRASQEQVGALLRLSVSDTVAEQLAVAPEASKGYESPSLNLRDPKPEPEPEPEPEPVLAGGFSRNSYAAEREQSLGGRLVGTPAPALSAPSPVFSTPTARAESPSLTPWVSAPAFEPERVKAPTAPAASRPAASAWLQAPIRSGGVSPWRKMVRWLQAPAGR
jgi:hypothetical protein